MKKIKRLAVVGLAAALSVLALSGCGFANGSGYRVVDMTSAEESAENGDEQNSAVDNGTEAANEVTGEEATGSESGSNCSSGGNYARTAAFSR